MGPVECTTKQSKLYAPDLGYTRRTSTLYVDEKTKGGTVRLQIRDNPSGTQGASNVFVERKSRGRPRKDNDLETSPKPQAHNDISMTVPVTEIE